MDREITKADYDLSGFNAKLTTFTPAAVAFTSKKAASVWYGRPTRTLSLGRQASLGGKFEAFILPSPSGAASRYWSLEPWRELVDWYRVQS